MCRIDWSHSNHEVPIEQWNLYPFSGKSVAECCAGLEFTVNTLFALGISELNSNIRAWRNWIVLFCHMSKM